MRRIKARHELLKDLLFILSGIVIAVLLSQGGLLDSFIYILGSGAFASFVAGIFFTSAFTIAPSSLALARIIESVPLQTVAFWGALGALCGDLILFLFIRDKFTDDLKNSLKPSIVKHILSSFHLGFMKWLSPIIGAFIIASPLPDELGLTLLGISKTRLSLLIPISFVMNFLGICALVWFANLF
ncbi:MAG: hypothetical protein AAB470_01850 [Patescibacteria group bacterium]